MWITYHLQKEFLQGCNVREKKYTEIHFTLHALTHNIYNILQYVFKKPSHVHYGYVAMSYPNMTAFHTMMLFSDGAPLTPAGGSSCSLHKKTKKRGREKLL